MPQRPACSQRPTEGKRVPLRKGYNSSASQWLSGEQVRLCSGHPKVYFGTIVEGSWVGCTVGPPCSLTIVVDRNVQLLLFVGCLTSQQQASASQGRICSDNFTCCHTEIEVADQTFYFTQSQYTDTGPTSPSADPITPFAWQGSHWSVNFLSHWHDSTPKKIPSQAGFEPGIFRSRGGRLTTRPTRRSKNGQTKVLDSWKVTQLNRPRQESVK